MYELGRGVPKDYKIASQWYRKAAVQGNGAAQVQLGVLYEFGRGVLQDYVAAHMWYNLAGTSGDLRIDKNHSRERIAQLMTPAQIAEAQRRARVCLKSSYKNCD